MVGNGGERTPEGFRQVRHAKLRVPGESGEDAQARSIGEEPEQAGLAVVTGVRRGALQEPMLGLG